MAGGALGVFTVAGLYLAGAAAAYAKPNVTATNSEVNSEVRMICEVRKEDVLNDLEGYWVMRKGL